MLHEQYDYYYISAAGTYQVYTGACTLGYIIIPKTTTGTITVVDGVSVSTANVALLSAGSGANTYILKCNMAFGIRVITSDSADKVTLAFRVK